MWRAAGQLVPVDIAVQVLEDGLYLPPVLKGMNEAFSPPHMIISVPLHIAVCENRAAGQFVPVDIALQVFDDNVYRPPLLKALLPLYPPHIAIWVPVHTAVHSLRAEGQLVPVDVAVHELVTGV